MIYFDNAATGGKKPNAVIAAVLSSIKICANAGRSGHKLSLSHAQKVLDTRKLLSDYFDGYGYDRVAFTKNCTEALNIAVCGGLAQGDHVVTTCMEHNSVLRALEALRKRGVITYDVCPLQEGNIFPETIKNLVKENTKMLVVTAASNVNGAIPPLDAIRKAVGKKPLFVVDGAQGGGHFPLSLRRTKIDALALAGHKGLYGIQGSGALLFSERFSPNPVLFGGTGSESFSLDMPDFYPDRLEAGTLSFPATVALYEGIEYLKQNGRKNEKKLLELTAFCIDGLRKIKNVQVYSEPNVCGIVAFSLFDRQSEEISGELSERGFCVRGGLHCAPKMHEALKTEENGLVRLSFSAFNTRSEIGEFLAVLPSL